MSSLPKHRSTPFQILVHLLMTPRGSGMLSWELGADQMNRLADDLRWIVLRRVFPELDGNTPYRALLQKHAIRVESLDSEFFRQILDVVKENLAGSFSPAQARNLSDLDCLMQYFMPVILQWAECEHSTSVARERTPSMEELITHEDSSGNVYQRFPDELQWAVQRLAPDRDADEPAEVPEEMVAFARRIASQLVHALKKQLETGRLDKYVLLMCRLEEDSCTWQMTHAYLKALGITRYGSWKSLSVVANRALREYIRDLPEEARAALHQDDPTLTCEEKHDRLRRAVSAALEIFPLPTPRELLASAAP